MSCDGVGPPAARNPFLDLESSAGSFYQGAKAPFVMLLSLDSQRGGQPLPLTFLQALYADATQRLAAAGVPQPEADVDWLLAYVTQAPRGQWRLRKEDPLTQAQQERFEALLVRRIARQPLQYILGTAPFGPLMLQVDKRALIPRPETELLLEQLLTQWPQVPQRFLDLGTGSGALALGVATLFSKACGVAVDSDLQALSLARENAQAHGLASRIEFLHSDWFSTVEGRFDLILANPPYLTQQEWAYAQPEVRDHEPYQALVAPHEGLLDLEKILKRAPDFLEKGGCLVLEIGITHAPLLQELAKKLPYRSTGVTHDLLGHARFFWAFL